MPKNSAPPCRRSSSALRLSRCGDRPRCAGRSRSACGGRQAAAGGPEPRWRRQLQRRHGEGERGRRRRRTDRRRDPASSRRWGLHLLEVQRHGRQGQARRRLSCRPLECGHRRCRCDARTSSMRTTWRAVATAYYKLGATIRVACATSTDHFGNGAQRARF